MIDESPGSLQIVKKDDLPHYALVQLESLPQKVVNQRVEAALHELKYRLVSAMKIDHDPETHIKYEHQLTAPMKDSLPKEIHFTWEKKGKLDVENVFRLMNCAQKLPLSMYLLGQGVSPHVDPEYRVLSLYKILEAEFAQGKLTKRGEKVLSFYKKELEHLGYEAKVHNFLLRVRASCSHILKNKSQLGFVSMKYEDLIELHKIIPLLGQIAFDVVSLQSRGKLRLGVFDENLQSKVPESFFKKNQS